MIRWSIAAALPLCLPAAALSQNVAEVQVAPPSVTIKVGERYGLLATAFDRGGNVIPTARTIWTSNNVGIARIDNNGTVTGVAAGVAIIEARVGSRKGQAAVQVTGTGGAVTTTTAPRTDQTPATGGPPPADGGGTGGVAPATGGGGGTVDPFAGQPAGTGPAAFLKIDPPPIDMLPS